MKRLLQISLLLGLIACQPEEPLDCNTIEEKIFACYDQYDYSGHRSFVEKCEPLAESARYHGTWAIAWEWNTFHQDQILPAGKGWIYPETRTYLDTSGTKLDEYYEFEKQQLFELEFIGRETACDIPGIDKTILVDKVLSTRAVEIRLNPEVRINP